MACKPEWIYGERWLKAQQRAKQPRAPSLKVQVVRRDYPGQLPLWTIVPKRASA
jgi:hypothetical protein